MSDNPLFDEKAASREVMPLSREDQLLAKVLESGNIEVLERFMKIRKEEAERQSMMKFHEMFSKMQPELPIIKKTREVKTTSGRHMFDYPELDQIQLQIKPIIEKYGFSYSWHEEAITEGNKRTVFDLYGWGYTKSNYFDSPIVGPMKTKSGDMITDETQAARKTSSQCKRYVLMDGLGLIVEGDDREGERELNPALQKIVDDLAKAKDMTTLQSIFSAAWRQYEGDTAAQGVFSDAKDKRKRELINGPTN